jgi:enoyl-CoA hydratase/carnithine racemase
MESQGEPGRPTVLGRGALESACRLLRELESEAWAAMILTGEGRVFCAGADIDEFPKIRTREQAIAGSRAGHDLFRRIAALQFPTVAAINGTCLGGGVELALHCDARTISSEVRQFALPECFLGIVPAWGGTQLLPRLVEPATAIRVVVQNPMRRNRMLSAAEAAAARLVDRVFEPARLIDASISFALELADGPGLER